MNISKQLRIMLHGGLLMSSIIIHGNQLHNSIPAVLPSALPLYEKIIDICMQLWNDIELLAHDTMQMPTEQMLKQLDSTIGRLVYVYLCINHIVSDNHTITPNDVQYLKNILRALNEAYDDFFNWYGEYERILCIKYIMHEIYHELAYISVIQVDVH